ncbi:MAG: enoyl-CoA hydratase/isomerase family protein [Panacagrimonas sp.]
MTDKTTPAIEIETHLDGRILLARLNRPKAANGINGDMATALETLASRLEESPNVDALVLTGTGRVFCGGGDVSVFREALAGTAPGSTPLADLLDGWATQVHSALERMVSAGPLIVGAINGPATGAGMGLVCACDVAYARPSAALRSGFSRLGMSPDTGCTYFLPRIVGERNALRLLLSTDRIDAPVALALGIFAELIDADDESFLSEVLSRTESLIASGRAARATRRLLRDSANRSLHDQLRSEQTSLVSLAALPEVEAQLRRALGVG